MYDINVAIGSAWHWPFFVLVCVAVAVGIWNWVWVRTRLRRFYDGPCRGLDWRQRFPDAASADIRTCLGLFVDAFALKRKAGLAFGPDDRLLDVYRALHPLEGSPDALEFETLGAKLEEKYGVILNDFWHPDLTLGEVYGRIHPPH